MFSLLLGAARSGVLVIGSEHRLQLQLLLPPPMLLPLWQARTVNDSNGLLCVNRHAVPAFIHARYSMRMRSRSHSRAHAHAHTPTRCALRVQVVRRAEQERAAVAAARAASAHGTRRRRRRRRAAAPPVSHEKRAAVARACRKHRGARACRRATHLDGDCAAKLPSGLGLERRDFRQAWAMSVTLDRARSTSRVGCVRG